MKPIIIPGNIDRVAKAAVDAAYHVHRELGPGLLETAYRQCLAYELTGRGIAVEQEKPVPLVYQALRIDAGFRADLILAGSLLLDLKAVELLLPVHEAQIITYLKVLNRPIGLLINFNVPLIRQGVHRKLNLGYRQPDRPRSEPEDTLAPLRLGCSMDHAVWAAMPCLTVAICRSAASQSSCASATVTSLNPTVSPGLTCASAERSTVATFAIFG